MDSNPVQNFIRSRIADDIKAGKHEMPVLRFPPEPNGYLHIGHAKSICLNFDLAREFGGRCNLRFDDTNPEREGDEYVRAIKEDIRWLGYAWDGEPRYASDYFEQLYAWAEHLVEHGRAFVDSQSAERIRETRGTLTKAGTDSPHRDRPVAESLDLLRRMRAGEFAEGEHVLRAKIDMASPNINMRDPILYRIRKVRHHRTGDSWPIYPTYDFTHGQSDAIERITHSLCTLEFEDHRPLYDWLIEHLPVPACPQQIEFARLQLAYTVTSKRRLKQLVDEGHVDGWDDPRMPTISGMRRRGFTPAAIRDFCRRVGVAKSENKVDMAMLEHALREDLNPKAHRMMAVLDPLRIVITNLPEDHRELVECPLLPHGEGAGTRSVPLTRELFVERDDFREDPPRKFFRLRPGGEVRLRNAFIIRCDEVIKDADGNVTSLRCSHDPGSRSGLPGAERKVKGTLHWVSASEGRQATVHLYDRLFTVPEPAAGEEDFTAHLNPDSRTTVTAVVEPALTTLEPGTIVQFERLGYFVADAENYRPEAPVFNRAVSLRDTWAKLKNS